MQYGSVFANLIDSGRPIAIDEGPKNTAVQSQLEAMTVESAFSEFNIVDRDAALCCISGVWLWHNFIWESHEISQEIHTTAGSYWHAIMHRREQDYSNAKYWFRSVSYHEVYEALYKEIIAIQGGIDDLELVPSAAYDPFAFVDLCQQVAQGRSNRLDLCQEITRVEWQLLFDDCFKSAVGA